MLYPVNKKVLILSEAIGDGHTKAAEALIDGLTHLVPTLEVKMLGLGHLLHPWATRMLVFFYLKMILLTPSLWRKIYQYHLHKPLSNWKKYLIYTLFHRKIEQILDQEQPHLIICTHPFCSATLSWLKQAGYQYPLCTVVTDFHVNGAWVHPEVDIYLVSNEHVVAQLQQMGVPAERIAVTGMPLRQNFWSRSDKRKMRQRLSLKEDLPTVMVMGGGLGLGGIQKLAYALLKWVDRIQVVICTGSNQKLLQSLQKDARFQHPHIRILGFINWIDQWMDSADLLITKPGGLTCFEALAKGLPLCIYAPISGHEEQNSDFLIKNQLAIHIDHLQELDQWLEMILFKPEKASSFFRKINQFQKRLNPLAHARFIIDWLQKQPSGQAQS